MQDRDIKAINLKNINNHLSELLKEQDLNFCKALIHNHKEDLSVTAKYNPPKSFISLSRDRCLNSSDFYYGVSPCLDKQEVISCISNFELRTVDKLNDYVNRHGDWFMMHSSQKNYLPALARYIVICMASYFGIRIKMDSQVYKELLYFLYDNGYSDDSIKTMLSYSENRTQSKKHEIRPKESFLTIKGCPTDEVIHFLTKYKYHYLCKNKAIPLIDVKTGKQKGAVEAWEIVNSDSAPEKCKTINEIYSKHTELIEGRVFYSGVLLKPTKLELIQGTQENYKIQSLCIHFERSTYGTVCALDRNLTEHPLLQNIKCQIIEMLQEDDSIKRNLNEKIEQLLDIEDADASTYMINTVNEYLSKCFNVNQIGVSANVVTRDGLLLIGQRSQANIDAKKLYPSVNGNAEVADCKVSFYSLSVYEDYPTIRLDSDRIDFFGEIGREAYGELKINLPKQEWKCCGIILTGKIPRENAKTACYQESSRRMHFNLIFEQHTDKSFLEIEELSANAAEAFETERYLGVSIKCEKNRLIHFLKTIARGIIGIVSQKDFIEAAVALILFLIAISHTISEESIHIDTLYLSLKWLNWTDALTLFLAVLIIIITGLRSLRTLSQYLHRRKQTRFITIYRRASYEDVNKQVKLAFRLYKYKNDLYPFHPAAAACLRYYVDNMICDAFFSKDKR